MPKLFISYARDDVLVVEKLIHILDDYGAEVWRDEVNLYGGQPWPTALGDAIAAYDVLVLVWSQYAAASPVVRREWNIAVALDKPILPCLLDETPLPNTLQPVNAIDIKNLDAAHGKIKRALQELAVPTTLPPNTCTILETLRDTPPGEAEQIAREAKSRLPQRHASQKRFIEHWRMHIAFVAGLLTIVALFTLLAKLPISVKSLFHAFSPQISEPITRPLVGIVWDENHKRLAGVKVEVPDLRLTAITDQSGTFAFQVKDWKQPQVRLIASKDGYTTYHAHPAFGNAPFELIMRKTQ